MANVEMTEKKKNTSKMILVIMVILLLLFNAFLLLKLVQKKEVEEDLVATKELKEQLEAEVKSFKEQVAELEGTKIEQDSTIVAYKKEIEEKVREIEDLLKKEQITRYKYNQALEEIKKLEYYTKKYQAEIKELERKNKQLTEENTELKTEVKETKKTVDKLTDKNVELSNKVSLGEMLKTNTINVLGIQKRNSGRLKETMRGKKMEALDIRFTIKDNVLAKEGNREFIIKVLNPKGETLYIEERGSGTFEYQGEESLYTVKADLDFVNNPDHVYNVLWDRGSPFEKGDYEARIYNNGVLIGKNTFTVK